MFKNQQPSALLSFMLLFAETTSLDAFSISCLQISKQFAVTRLITRFFDDIPAIYNLLHYLNNTFSIFKNNQIHADENNNKVKKKSKKEAATKVSVCKTFM